MGKSLMRGAAVVFLVIMANAVAAGIVAIAAYSLPPFDDEAIGTVVAWAIIMVAAVWAAICFLQGAIIQLRRTGT